MAGVRRLANAFQTAWAGLNLLHQKRSKGVEAPPPINLSQPTLRRLERLTKRLLDVAVSVSLLFILAPVMLAIALLIKLDTSGPVLFHQRRVGEGGRLFRMYKFRSMIVTAQGRERHLWQKTVAGRSFFAKSAADERVTRVGRWLRRTSLDELPQLFNVAKGDMSLVGPRPELPWLVEKYALWHHRRLTVPQGMTGWWQVSGRMKRPDLSQRLADDLFYVRNYSLWLDLQILWKTVQAVIRGEGAY